MCAQIRIRAPIRKAHVQQDPAVIVRLGKLPRGPLAPTLPRRAITAPLGIPVLFGATIAEATFEAIVQARAVATTPPQPAAVAIPDPSEVQEAVVVQVGVA